MAKRKSRFPSYGLVRGASHAQGGVAGMVAGEQPVELEGGEWIIPKEAVPDYLPVLKQITNEGRAMQQMQNGNSAMDALIASASMENGLTQPKSPMYQDGGQIAAEQNSNKLMADMFPESERAAHYKVQQLHGDVFDVSKPKPYDLERLLSELSDKEFGKALDYMTDFEDKYSLSSGEGSSEETHLDPLNPLAVLTGIYRARGGRQPRQTLTEDPRGATSMEEVLAPLMQYKEQGGMIDSYEGGGELHSRRMYNQKDEDKYGYRAGGPVNYYQEGGKAEEAVKFRSPLLNKQKYTMTDLMALEAGMPKDEMLVGYDDIRDMDSPRVKALQELAGVLSTRIQSETQKTPEYGLEYHLRGKPERSVLGDYASYGNRLQRTINGIPMIDPVEVRPEYQQGGQIQPRKQQEMRNPEVYGPPTDMMTQMAPDTTGNGLQNMLNQLQMREANQSINPFSGDSLDIEGDSLQLLQSMKKSEMPRYGRKKMQQGGQIGEGQPLESRPSNQRWLDMSNPNIQAIDVGNQGSLMNDASRDSRVVAPKADEYRMQLIPNTPGDTTMIEIPKLSSAYLPSYGIETPLSKRQNSLLRERQIPPQMLNSQVRSLIDRALVQQLSKEPL